MDAGSSGAGARRALFAAAAFAASAAVVWAVAFRTAAGARADEAALADILGLGAPRTRALATRVADLADPRPIALFTVAITCVALVRRGPRVAAITCVLLVGANVTTQALKQLTAEPRGIESLPGAHVAPESWPSGHATAGMALALCLVALAPSRLRPVAATLGGGFALAVGASVLLLGWHLPSDVLGGFCVAAAWTMAGLAAARPIRRRRAHDAAAV